MLPVNLAWTQNNRFLNSTALLKQSKIDQKYLQSCQLVGWAIADHAARHHLSMPDDLRVLPQQLWGPQSASQTAAADSQVSAFKTLRGCLNVEYRQRVLTAVYEATTERLYGRTYALSSFKCYREILAHGRAVPPLRRPSVPLCCPLTPLLLLTVCPLLNLSVVCLVCSVFRVSYFFD
jgi:hypothetical protein